jgi:RNA polymerase sigma factor (sigma-70 family)
VNEYRIRVSVRNNLLLSAIEAAGYASQAAFARAIGASVTALNGLVALRDPPINRDGEFSALAKQVMEVLGAAPNDLWTDEQLYLKLKRNSASAALGAEELKRLMGESLTAQALPVPEEFVEALELTRDVREALTTLTVREVQVLRMRHKEEKTFAEISAALGVTPTRAQQIEHTAYRKLRRPRVAEKLVEHIPALREEWEQDRREQEARMRQEREELDRKRCEWEAARLQKEKDAKPT